MKVARIGEFGLINILSRMTAGPANRRHKAWRDLIVGMGDDATVWRAVPPVQIATVDSLVQDIHFSLKTTTWEELGWKSLAVNLSDIAAMGGEPLYALVSLGLPPDTRVEDVTALYNGMLSIAGQYRVAIVGGDTVSSPVIFISVTVFGCTGNKEGRVLTRAAAEPGDYIAVTGYLGASAAGLEMLAKRLQFDAETAARLRKAHLLPVPRLAEGRLLLAKGVRCAMDLSDGLMSDLTRICEMSQVGARIEIDRVPIDPSVKAHFGQRATALALAGGEDYELLFTARPAVIRRVCQSISLPVTVVGEITAQPAGRVVAVDSTGKTVNLKKSGWDHFKAK